MSDGPYDHPKGGEWLAIDGLTDRELPHPAPIKPRVCTVAEVQVGDFIEAWDGYGEVIRVKGPTREIGDGTVDWYTFHIVFEDEHGRKKPYRDAVGPMRGDRPVTNWS